MRISVTGVQNLCLIYVCLWTTAPPLAYPDWARLLSVLAMLIWAGTDAARRGGIFRRPTLPVLLAMAYIVYTGAVEFLYDGAGGVTRNLQLFIMLMFLIVHESRRNDLDSLRPVFWAVLLTLPIWQVITISVLQSENAHAARILVRSTDQAEALMARGIGGYSLVYGTLLALPAVVALLPHLRRIRPAGLPGPLRAVPLLVPAVVALNAGLGIVLIASAGFSIAAIAMLLSLATLLIYRNEPLRIIALIFVCVLCLFLAKPLLETALTSILPYVEGTKFAKKVSDILTSLSFEASVGTVEMRAERYLRSFDLFLGNPATGVLKVGELGKHSQILDDFAQFGLIWGSVFVYLISYLPLRYLRREALGQGLAAASLMAVWLVLGLNNAFSAAGPMLFIVFPVAARMVAEARTDFAVRQRNAHA